MKSKKEIEHRLRAEKTYCRVNGYSSYNIESDGDYYLGWLHALEWLLEPTNREEICESKNSR